MELVMVCEGQLKSNADIYQLGYRDDVSASAGTHSGGGVMDIGQWTDPQLHLEREYGGCGQHRTRAQGFGMDHNHLFLRGCPHLSVAARAQEADWLRGRNGLVSHGPITGPGPKGKDTPSWSEGVKMMEEYLMELKDDIAAEVVKRLRGEYGAIADAVLDRDGKIPNTVTDNAANKFLPLKYMLAELGANTEALPRRVWGSDEVDVIPAPGPVIDPKNPDWYPSSYLRETFRKLMAHDAQLGAIRKQLADIEAKMDKP